MTGRSVPPPLAIRGGLRADNPEFARWCDGMWRLVGGLNARIGQEIITRASESPVPVFQAVETAQPVAVVVIPTLSEPVAVGIDADLPQPVPLI